nr:GNAT family N-acetyltransferase [Streptomyces sp. MJP52]
MRAQTGDDGRSVPCPGLPDGRPMSHGEVHRAGLDPLADHSAARPHDTGVHPPAGEAAGRRTRTGRPAAARGGPPGARPASRPPEAGRRARRAEPRLPRSLPEGRFPPGRHPRAARQAGRPDGPRAERCRRDALGLVGL